LTCARSQRRVNDFAEFFPTGPLPGLAPVLVDVIFEAIERIREEGDTGLLMGQHALAAFEVAD